MLDHKINRIRCLFFLWIENIRSFVIRQSIFITLSRFSDIGFGFIFWIFATHLFSMEDVGIATAFISSLGLIMLFSRFGFDSTIIRYIPLLGKGPVIITSTIILTLSSVIVGVLFLVLIPFISPSLILIQSFSVIFLLFVIANSLYLTTGISFIGIREAKVRFAENLFLGLRIPLIFIFTGLGVIGIFCSYGLAYVIAAFFGIIMLKRYVAFKYRIDTGFIKESMKFNVSNYIASIFQTIPPLLLPLLILNVAGGEDAAKYFIALSIANILLIIPDAIGTAFMVEGSHGSPLRLNAFRSVIGIYSVLVPCIVAFFLFGGMLLGLFGPKYVESLELLRLFVVATLFIAMYNFFIPLQYVRMRVSSVILSNCALMIVLLSLSYVFLTTMGLIGVGLAYLISYSLAAVFILIWVWKKGWMKESVDQTRI